jgi:hypothetical protein
LEALGIRDVGRPRPGQGRLTATTDQHRRNVGHHPVDQPSCQKRAGQGRATLKQDRAYPPLAERLQQQLQVQAGRITVDGTIGFVVFTGLFLGLPSAAGYLLVRRWLPAGRAAGLAYGALLLVVAGTRLEPLRRGNQDFDLVGPGWVSVVAFTALVVFHGALVAALAGRLSRAVPLLTAQPRAIAVYAPLFLLALPGPAVALVLMGVGVAVVLVSRIPAMVAAWHSRAVVAVGRVALAVAALVAVPGFASALVDILGRP